MGNNLGLKLVLLSVVVPVTIALAGSVKLTPQGQIDVNQTDTNSSAVFTINNTGSSVPSVLTTTNGSGAALRSYATGMGKAGHFEINNSGSSAPALYAITNGTGLAGEFQGKTYFSDILSIGGYSTYFKGKLHAEGGFTALENDAGILLIADPNGGGALLNVKGMGCSQEITFGTQITLHPVVNFLDTIWQHGSVLHADYVFEDDYNLESIEEHARFMWQEKHLKSVPGLQQDENGKEMVEIGTQRRGILEELEKAHIYIEQLDKTNKKLEEKNRELEERLTAVEALVKQISAK